MHVENIIRQKKLIRLSQFQQRIQLSVCKCEASNEKFLSSDTPKAYVKKDYLRVVTAHCPNVYATPPFLEGYVLQSYNCGCERHDPID
jgi:hypothetical protein